MTTEKQQRRPTTAKATKQPRTPRTMYDDGEAVLKKDGNSREKKTSIDTKETSFQLLLRRQEDV